MHCLVVNFLRFKVTRDIAQLSWVYFNTFNTHLLGFKTVKNKKNCCRLDAHYHVAHLLRPKMIGNKYQHVWAAGHCLVANLLCFKTIRGIRQEVWLIEHCFVTYLLCLKVIRHHHHQVSNNLKGINFIYLFGPVEGQNIP